MDGFRHQQQQQSSGTFWYPSSSPPPPPQPGYPPPPPHLLQHAPLNYHHQQSYASPLPINPPSQHQLWFHPPQQPGPIPPQASSLSHYPPPYHGQPGIPPPYPPPHYRYPPPSQPHPIAPPPSSAYPPTGQAWGNQPWQQHQLWEYPDRNIPYNNEEDWAAKARAWASADSMPENHHAHSQFTQPGRVEEHEYAYRDHLPKVVTPIDKFPPAVESNGRALYDEDETVTRGTGHLTPTPRSYYPNSSVYEQEVPYTYSSSQDNNNAMNYRERPQESLHPQFLPPVQLSSVEESHFVPGNLPAKSSYDISDKPLDFQPKSGFNQLKQFSYNHVDLAANDRRIDQNFATTSVHAWSSTAASVVAYPTVPLTPSGAQFDPSIVSQPIVPVHSAPPFGGVAGPNYVAPISPVSTPFGLGVGTSLHATNFIGDGNGSLSLSERPKKAAVPNWLREEIIKKKSAIASTNLLHSVAAEMDDADMSRRTDQTDDKSLDSRRSIEDEEDDEDEVEAARTAAINQEIKRILTEVLLKVTDELFDEIANKVLDEDEPNAEVIEISIQGNSKLSPPPIIPTPKESTKILVPPRIDSKNINASESSEPNLTGGDLLGLGNYDSDASRSENDDESREELSRTLDSTSQQLETNPRSYEHSNKYVKTGKEPMNVDTIVDMQKERNIPLPDSREREKAGKYHGNTPILSETSEKTSSANYENTGKSFKSNYIASNERARRYESTNRDTNEEFRDGEAVNLSDADRKINISAKARGPIKDVVSGSHRNDNGRNDTENNSHGYNSKEITERKGNFHERFGDKSVKQGTSERDNHSKSSFRSDSIKARTEISKDKVEKQKGYEKRNNHKTDPEGYKRDEKEDRSKFARDSFKRKIRSKSPVSIGRHGKDNSVDGRGSSSSDESFDHLRKRKLHSRESSLSASPRRSTKRQVSRSPHSRNSHSRHSPYSTTRRNRRSRSISPVHRRRPSKA